MSVCVHENMHARVCVCVCVFLHACVLVHETRDGEKGGEVEI